MERHGIASADAEGTVGFCTTVGSWAGAGSCGPVPSGSPPPQDCVQAPDLGAGSQVDTTGGLRHQRPEARILPQVDLHPGQCAALQDSPTCDGPHAPLPKHIRRFFFLQSNSHSCQVQPGPAGYDILSSVLTDA